MPLDKIAFYGAGWQIHAENLAAHLAGREPGDVEARWEELVPPYQVLAANVMSHQPTPLSCLDSDDRRKHARLGQCFGMTPEEVRLDVAEADEFSLVCQSLLGACP
jgi:hypothetical protein